MKVPLHNIGRVIKNLESELKTTPPDEKNAAKEWNKKRQTSIKKAHDLSLKLRDFAVNPKPIILEFLYLEQSSKKDIYRNLAWTVLAAGAFCFLTKGQSFGVYSRSSTLLLAAPAILLGCDAALQHFGFSDDMERAQYTGIVNIISFIAYLKLSPIPITSTSQLSKLCYLSLLAFACKPQVLGDETPSVITISASVLKAVALMSFTSTLGYSSSPYTAVLALVSMFNIAQFALPYLEAKTEDKPYANAVKAAVAVCALGTALYATGGAKVIYDLNFTSLFSSAVGMVR